MSGWSAASVRREISIPGWVMFRVETPSGRVEVRHAVILDAPSVAPPVHIWVQLCRCHPYRGLGTSPHDSVDTITDLSMPRTRARAIARFHRSGRLRHADAVRTGTASATESDCSEPEAARPSSYV